MTQAFNLALLGNKVNTSGSLNAATGLYNATPVANGGTGAATLAANNVLLGNGTSAVQAVAPSTSGNVLQSNGTTWVSSAVPAPSTTDVLNATAAATYGGVGTYIFAYAVSGSPPAPGGTIAGSSLRAAHAGRWVDACGNYFIVGNGTAPPYNSAVALSGTWRLMGYMNTSLQGGGTVYLRIS